MVQSRAAQDRNADNINSIYLVKVFTFHNYSVNIAKVLKPGKLHTNMFPV